MSNETYRIEHISDLVLIPADRVDAMLADLAMALAGARLTWEIVRAQGHTIDDFRTFLPCIEWTDDGKREATAMLNGKPAFTIAEEST